jgi:acetyl-CoA carboxylase biotin carboxylase subunit
MFSRVLIANRGEIALRVLRACRGMGLEAVVAHSEADRDTRAVQLADESVCIGPAESGRSYLSAAAIISAALVSGCDAIHPGYGFLSEDETFAEMTRAHDLGFIGPSADVLERFASKAGTRELLSRHGLPVVPGSEGMLRDDAHALAEAERIGYPVLVKPSAGGGGKGMRMVRTARELQQALIVCRSEARAAFGDDSLYLEKWLEDTRHVEVQVVIDRYGDGVHLGERDCSVQPSTRPRGATSASGPRARRWRPATRTSAPWSSSSTERVASTSSRSTPASRSSIPSPRCSRASTSWPSRSASRPASRWATARRT